MENKINVSAIELYARKALKPLLDRHFTQLQLDGQQLLTFCPIEQVNFFALQILFDKWQHETQKLQSPYFDFKHEKVQSALKAFMNELSQHLLVGKEDFTPVLLQAVHHCLLYALSPIQFLEQQLKADTTYSADELKSVFKYLKLHPPLVNYAKVSLPQWDGKSGKTILEAISDAHVNIDWEASAQETIDQLNEVLPVRITDFQYKESTKPISKPASTTPSLNEIVGKEQRLSVLSIQAKNKVVDIRSAMSINQRFMFIKELFKGNEGVFQQAMDFANNCENYESAVNGLIDNYSPKYGWEIDSEPVNQLFDLVGKKFYPSSMEETKG
jgi:hypothetical protein